VAPNWVLTCAHVALRGEARAEGATVSDTARKVGVSFGGRSVPGVVEWAEPDAPPDRGWWPAPDLALIRLLEPVVHPCLWLTERTSKVFTQKGVAFFGSTMVDGEVEDFSGRCVIRGELGRQGKLRLDEDEIPEGISGGPLVDLARGEVIGVVKARRSGADDGGLAISVVQLRRIPLPGTPVGSEADDLYQRVVHAHDRYHADLHRNVHHAHGTWPDAQSDMRACSGRALTPGRRAQLLGLLAELPPPASTRGLEDIVTELRGQRPEGLPLAPRGWRDGLGLLYDLRKGQSELEAVLRYAVHAATADRPYPAAPGTEQRVWEWADHAAADAELPRGFRRRLVEERSARLQSRTVASPCTAAPSPRTAVSAAGGAPPYGRGGATPGALGAPPAALLEIVARWWEPGRHDWRVCVARTTDELDVVDEGHGAYLDALPQQLSGPLSEAFRRLDEPGRPAPLHVALPSALFGLPVDDWRIPAADTPLGVSRPVLVRCCDRPADEADGRLAARVRRWRAVHDGPLRPVAVVDCDDGRPLPPVAKAAALRALDVRAVPALCRSADTDPAAHQGIVTAGFGVALWRRGPGGGDWICADYHRGLRRTMEAAGSADRLPAAVWRLRADTTAGVPEAYWSKGIALLYDDPTSPLPGDDHLLETP
jgi:hypothetical protein